MLWFWICCIPDTTAYDMSKLAMILFTYELAAKLKDTKIVVHAVNPGTVATSTYIIRPFQM